MILEGQVDNLAAKNTAESFVEKIIGVIRIKNLLKVRVNELNQYIQIKNLINAVLSWDTYLSSEEIDIVVKSDRVYLYGNTNNLFEVRHAEQVISSIKGV